MIRAMILCMTILTLSGCGGSSKAKVYPVKGTVKTKAGVPCAGALVVFHPQDKGKENDAKPVATVKEDGSFVLTTHEADDGAPEGEYGVTVVWNVKAKEAKLSLGGEGGGSMDKLGGRYGDPRAPKLKATVKPNSDNLFTFEID